MCSTSEQSIPPGVRWFPLQYGRVCAIMAKKVEHRGKHTVPRFFISGGSSVAGGVAFIAGEDAAHARVLRLHIGDRVIVCDGNGQDHHCSVTRISPDMVEAEVLETRPCPAEPSVRVTVMAGLPKGDKAEYIIQKCTECGASEILFFPSHRCVMKLDRGAGEKKLSRWQRIAEEAAKQSGRGVIPRVGLLGGLDEAFNTAAATDLPLFLYETGERETLKEAVESAGAIRTAAIITGPEGGFEGFEAELAALMKLRVCSMGSRIFRCETAPVAALSALMYATDNL